MQVFIIKKKYYIEVNYAVCMIDSSLTVTCISKPCLGFAAFHSVNILDTGQASHMRITPKVNQYLS